MIEVPTTSTQPPIRAFIVTWFGQLVSVVGSGLTSFAIGVRVYQDTGSITQLSIVSVLYVLPMLIASPLAGALVDRLDRRRAMMIADAGAGLGALLIWVLLAASRAGLWHLEPYHFFIPIAVISTFGAIGIPAYQASITALVPKEQLGRASGLVELAAAVGQVATPVLAGALIARIGLERLILIDVGTFGVALIALGLVRFPSIAVTSDNPKTPQSLRNDITYGLRFLWARPGFLRLVGVLFVLNFVGGLVTVLITPLVLSIANITALGVTLSIGGAGMLLGGIVASVWGGPKRRILGVVGFVAISGFALLMGLLPPSVALFSAGTALFLFCVPLIATSSQSLWLSKVAPAIQGRVFAARRMIGLASAPIGNLVAGPIADRCFEPWLAPGGALADTIGRVMGTGPGRGIALLFIALGGILLATAFVARLSKQLWQLDNGLPDAGLDTET